MSDERRTKLREAIHVPKIKMEVRSDAESVSEGPLRPEQGFLKRQAEVTQQDHEQFSEYLQEKSARDRQEAARPADAPPVAPSNINRRSMLKWAAGTAVAGETVALGYTMVTGQDVPAHGVMHSGATSAEAQRHHIERELINPQADVRGRQFGNWVLLMPTKMSGGTYAVNLNTGRALAWISYWNYGDYNPISHHLCAFPSADPTKGFEWVNSTQGGKNSLIYGIPTSIETPAEGFNIYRVRYDGAQMEVMENVAETTGLGLGVHVTIDPKTAERYFVTDGQKDIAACFDRRTSRVIAAIKYDWVPNVRTLADGWQKGGVLKISKIYPDAKTGKYDYLGTKGQKIEWEMVPMGELFVEEGTLPGDDVHGLCGADGTIWHPTGRWASTVVRLCGGQVILDAEKNFEPVAFLQFNKDAPRPVSGQEDRRRSLGGDVRQGLLARPRDRLLARRPLPLHDEQSAREQLLGVRFERPRPAQLEKDRPCRGPAVARQVSEPVPHGVLDGQLQALSVDPAPLPGHQRRHGGRHQDLDGSRRRSRASARTCRRSAITYDGKYVVGVFSGFQRLSSGIAFIDAETDELVGIWPSNGGHHDCVIIPTKLEHMKHTRSCTL